jgi:hypothetical protein
MVLYVCMMTMRMPCGGYIRKRETIFHFLLSLMGALVFSAIKRKFNNIRNNCILTLVAIKVPSLCAHRISFIHLISFLPVNCVMLWK